MKQATAHKKRTDFSSSHTSYPPLRDFLSTREAARMLGLAVGTVQKMVDDGTLKAWTTSGGHRRIHADSVNALITVGGQNKAFLPSNRRLSVLIAEDDLVQCKIYEASIGNWDLPIDLRIVPDGFSALVEAGRSMPDVMVIDLMMPGMDGFELIRRISSDKSFCDTDIMVVTGLPQQEIEAAGGLPPGALVIKKPIPFEVLYGFMSARLVAKLRNQLPNHV